MPPKESYDILYLFARITLWQGNTLSPHLMLTSEKSGSLSSDLNEKVLVSALFTLPELETILLGIVIWAFKVILGVSPKVEKS